MIDSAEGGADRDGERGLQGPVILDCRMERESDVLCRPEPPGNSGAAAAREKAMAAFVRLRCRAGRALPGAEQE